ncbi:MAG: hypothetical protein UHE93_06535 [Muribaculaceae bacterium]|nr:hypothetical protein [Muribaculaceae bacterium]
MEEISILGRTIKLQPLIRQQLKGITIGDSLAYQFYAGDYHGIRLIFLKSRSGNPSPKVCAITANRVSDIMRCPVVFILESSPSYERQRLIDKDVFFVMGDKFANLPMLVANERIRKSRLAKRLTPVAQYILLYHLQIESLEGLSARNMSNLFPYSYESITLGLTCLSDLGLCRKVSEGAKSKIIRFSEKGKELWDKAADYLIDPVEKRIYCDYLATKKKFVKCSINALSHYTRLNPDNSEMLMMSKREFHDLITEKSLHNMNEFDGNVMIEIWRYPVVSLLGSDNEWVDRLSLAISLREDDDPRVEGELERLINETEWKD